MSLYVFIPAYQAESTLADVIRRIPAEAWDLISRVAVIDDGSRDGTAAVARELARREPRIVVDSFGENRGYGHAVRRGLELARASDASCAACLHADGQYPPEKLSEFSRVLAARRLDILQGSRHRAGGARAGGMPFYKILAGRLLVRLENRVFGLELTDYHSGFLLYSRRALDEIPFEALGPSFDFDLQAIACARALGLAVGEEPIPTRYAGEVSHLSPIPYGLRVLRVLWRYRRGEFRRLAGRGAGR